MIHLLSHRELNEAVRWCRRMNCVAINGQRGKEMVCQVADVTADSVYLQGLWRNMQNIRIVSVMIMMMITENSKVVPVYAMKKC